MLNNIEIGVRGHSRSLNGAIRKLGCILVLPSKVTMAVFVAPFDRPHMSSYSASIVTIVSFARYSDLLVENREIVIPHLYLTSPQRVTRSEFCKNV